MASVLTAVGNTTMADEADAVPIFKAAHINIARMALATNAPLILVAITAVATAVRIVAARGVSTAAHRAGVAGAI